jgi:hypothetical protein
MLYQLKRRGSFWSHIGLHCWHKAVDLRKFIRAVTVHTRVHVLLLLENQNKLRALSPRGCRVFSATDPYGHILGFLDLAITAGTRA